MGRWCFQELRREYKLEDILKMHIKAWRNIAVSIPGIYLEETWLYKKLVLKVIFFIIAVKLETNCMSGSRELVI